MNATPPPTSASDSVWLQPGTLWPQVRLRSQSALACGALHPIPTNYDWVEQQNIRFLVRQLANVQRKEEAKREQNQRKNFNPFLPYDAELFVANLSPTHLVLLNKFNVMDHHILLVTREFESQDSVLTEADFQALALGLSEIDGLAFYNGGKIAGASQPHKHLQIVPLPFTPEGSQLPLEPLMLAEEVAHLGRNPVLPYCHAIAQLSHLDFTQPLALAQPLLTLYHQLLASMKSLAGAYNLLVTRRWMCLVPRSQEAYAGISINSLGFSGAFLVKSSEQFQVIVNQGPMAILTAVSYANQ